jgi:hypothetical protein
MSLAAPSMSRSMESSTLITERPSSLSGLRQRDAFGPGDAVLARVQKTKLEDRNRDIIMVPIRVEEMKKKRNGRWLMGFVRLRFVGW